MPRIRRQRVRDTRVHAARHALRKGSIVVREGDGVLRQRSQVPEMIRPIVRSAVKGVGAVVLLEVVGHAVEREGAVADAVGVAAGDGVVDGVAGVDGWEGLVLGDFGEVGGGGGRYGSRWYCRSQGRRHARCRSCP